MRIGILVCGRFPTRGEPPVTYPQLYERMLAGQGFTFQSYDVVDMEFPASVKDADGWLLTGSRHGAYEDVPFIAPLEAFIREAYAADIPQAGICFGHQIIAQALGGKVEKFEGGWSCGPLAYDFGEARAVVHAWHQDQVVEVPGEARVIASAKGCKNAAFAYQGRAFSVQPHPEFEDAEVRMIAEGRARKVVPAETLERVSTSWGTPLDNGWMAKKIGDFFKEGYSSI